MLQKNNPRRRFLCRRAFVFWFFLCAAVSKCAAQNNSQTNLTGYADFALRTEGDVARGKVVFNNEQKTMCMKCHSVDGSSSKAGPDLSFIGDKFPRRDLITAVLEPSAAIAIGYDSTTIVTKSDEEYTGVIKQANDSYIGLMGGDGKLVRIPTGEIASLHANKLSLMPAGLQAGLSLGEFCDLIEYLASLKHPVSTVSNIRGMPSDIPEIPKPITVRPFISEELRFPHSVVENGKGVRSGLTWFGQLPGLSNAFLVVHETGQIWLLQKNGAHETKSLFVDLSKEIFGERGPNGLLSIAFHPQFLRNRKYYLNHQVLADGNIVSTLVEREVSADFRTDAGKPSRLIWKSGTSTQNHTGGGIAFGPDGFLYIGMGDTGPQGDPEGHGQNLGLQLGKMLRIDVDNQDAGHAYAIPAGNPFRGRPGAQPEIWAYGLREPWRFSFDPVTGDLWVGDVGQDRIEEVDIVRRGENYGWNVFEGFDPFSNVHRREGETYTPPVFAYNRHYGFCVVGGFVYRGDKSSPFYGVYIFADYTSKRIFALKQHDRLLDAVRQIGTCPQSISSFGTDEQGNIYIVGYEGMLYKLDFDGITFP
jgi:putative heme-binding domain-containing protein